MALVGSFIAIFPLLLTSITFILFIIGTKVKTTAAHCMEILKITQGTAALCLRSSAAGERNGLSIAIRILSHRLEWYLFLLLTARAPPI